MAPWRRGMTLLLTLLLLGAAVANTATFYQLLSTGAIRAAVRVPVSAFLTVALFLISLGLQPAVGHIAIRRRGVTWVVLACALGFPLAQICVFGWTDYRRPADIIVVLGAKVFADGTPSTALSDRVRTACALYHAGLAPRLLCSGGPGDGPTSEPQAMRAMAVHRGVPAGDIILDEQGVDTRATVRNSLPVFRQHGVRRVLVVSHFFHLPRIKMTYQRAGWDVYTVPAHDQQLRATVPYLVAREVVALWAYYLSPLWGG
jgi:uncharacterized SAM-binding protein YcdF (DUF218 family)